MSVAPRSSIQVRGAAPATQHGRSAFQRSMATIQSTTDVRSAAHHFKQQRHMPYFMEYLMWVLFGSEGLHLIWLKSEYNEYQQHAERKIELLKQLLQHLEAGEPVPEALRKDLRMVMMNQKQISHHDDHDDEYLEQLIAAAEEKSVPPQQQEEKPIAHAGSSNDTKPAAASKPPSDKPKFII
ncbi:hypothetical protein BC940DRAFT_333034 [Gongronella butleri]|nr:hypothetical protein BC940DRAFT_333034 [Gongronella butleri]